MPEEIVARILRLPGYGVYAWEADEASNTLTLSIRQTAGEPYYVCGGCGSSVREIHSWTERIVSGRCTMAPGGRRAPEHGILRQVAPHDPPPRPCPCGKTA